MKNYASLIQFVYLKEWEESCKVEAKSGFKTKEV